jgi:hypothetical protein
MKVSNEKKVEEVLTQVEEHHQVFIQEMHDTCLQCDPFTALGVSQVLKNEYPKYVVEHWEHCLLHQLAEKVGAEVLADEVDHILELYYAKCDGGSTSPTDLQEYLDVRGHQLTYRECCYLMGDSKEEVDEYMVEMGLSGE